MRKRFKCLILLGKGMKFSCIGSELNISEKTVHFHLNHYMKKFNITLTQLMIAASHINESWL